MTREESERILTSLRRYYPNAKIFSDVGKLEDFRAVILPHDYAAVVAVCKNHVRTCKFFPLPAEIITQLPHADAPVDARNSAANDPWVIAADKALDAEIEARGGVCALLHEYGGVVGETIRAHYPDKRFCGEKCRKVAVKGKCPYENMLHREE